MNEMSELIVSFSSCAIHLTPTGPNIEVGNIPCLSFPPLE